MPIDLKEIKKAGGTPAKLKALFQLPHGKKPLELQRLIDLQTRRMQRGIDQNLRDGRHWWALDQAYDTPHRQITYTLVRGLLDKNTKKEELISKAHDWGLTSMLTPFLDKEGKEVMLGNEPAMKLEMPTFVNFFVPLVMAYLKIRWARLFNERDQYPFYKYEPVRLTLKDKLKCDLITSRVQRMVVDMGTRDVERQSIFQMLLYGVCFNFPREGYYQEKQRIAGEDTVVKEGIRFTHPHPSRLFYDMTQPAYTFNSDTGADFAGFWEICRYGSVFDNPDYWNKKKITWSKASAWPWSDGYRIFQSFYPCQVRFPSRNSKTKSDLDRQDAAFTYTDNDFDAAVNVVVMFQKLVPKDWGLYDYPYPVWHRFVYAGEGTVIHCEPLAYNPVTAYLYDYDAERSRNASLGLEVLPWQDELGNLLSQYLLTIRKNLTRVVFWNSDILTDADIAKVVNSGEKNYQELRFIPFSGKEHGFGEQNVGQAFHAVNFNAGNPQEAMQAIGTVLTMMERALGFSSQELAAAASHEQSATEVKVTTLSTSNKLNFTGGFIDTAIYARKKLLYEALMAYSDDEIFAEVADMNEAGEKALKEMGFKVEKGDAGDRHAGVTGSKKSLSLQSFSSERDGQNRIDDAKLAQAMIQTFQGIFSNPMIVESIGVEQLFDLFNQILVWAGLPRDFRLRFDPSKKPQQNAEAANEQMKKLIAEVQKTAVAAGAKAAQEVVANEMGQLGGEIKEKLLTPLAQRQQQAEEAVQGVQQMLAQIAKKDQQQDAAIKNAMLGLDRVMQMAQAAAQQPPQQVPVPVPVDPMTGQPLPPPPPPGTVVVDPATGQPVQVA